MAPLPQLKTPTLAAIEAHYEAKRKTRHGYRLPPSKLGSECDAALWHSFRWTTPPTEFSGQMIRLFETGDIQETRLIADLRAIGVDVVDFDPDKPEKQIGVSFADGHGYGWLDGEVLGLPEAPATIHIFEAKSHNQKSFDKLLREGVEKSKPEHWSQMQTYMHLRHRDRAVYVAVNKNTDEIYIERVEYDFAAAVRLMNKADRIAFAAVPPAGVSTKPDFYLCKFCDHAERCHGSALPEKNCRTCAHSTPISQGRWICELHNSERDREQQEAGCDDHLFIPAIVPGDQVDADLTESRITYALKDGRTFHNQRKSNGGDHYA